MKEGRDDSEEKRVHNGYELGRSTSSKESGISTSGNVQSLQFRPSGGHSKKSYGQHSATIDWNLQRTVEDFR
jgi:hypothetical protein